jgi:hypothetical protein
MTRLETHKGKRKWKHHLVGVPWNTLYVEVAYSNVPSGQPVTVFVESGAPT